MAVIARAGARRVHFVRDADRAWFAREPPCEGPWRRVGAVSTGPRGDSAVASDADGLVLWYRAAGDDGNDSNGANHEDETRTVGSPLHVPLLKSALQKCVRRRLTREAASIAAALVTSPERGHVDALLRRIVVILVEDAVALPGSTVVVVWLMAAHSKGYALDPRDRATVASCVLRAAACPVRDCVPPRDMPHGDLAFGRPDVNHALVDALLLRARYGGTRGDVSLLVRCASLWHARLAGPDGAAWRDDADALERSLVEVGGIDPPALSGVLGEFGRAVVPLEAVDFHCFPSMPETVARRCVGDGGNSGAAPSPDEVREAIWHHRSSINTKRAWTDPAAPTDPPSRYGPRACTRGISRPEIADDRVDGAALARTRACWARVAARVAAYASFVLDRQFDRERSEHHLESVGDHRSDPRRGRKRHFDEAMRDPRQTLIRSFLVPPPRPT
jgi:hypothetical protein